MTPEEENILADDNYIYEDDDTVEAIDLEEEYKPDPYDAYRDQAEDDLTNALKDLIKAFYNKEGYYKGNLRKIKKDLIFEIENLVDSDVTPKVIGRSTEDMQ